MKVRALQLDGSLPNIAIMATVAHHRRRGDDVEFAFVGTEEEAWYQPDADLYYASLIFEKTRPVAEALVARRGTAAIVGGTGWDYTSKLEHHGIDVADTGLDYSIYPTFEHSIGFTQRGCRLKCRFCVVPKKEGGVRSVSDVEGVWRGEPHPKNLVLLDNDFFGQPEWPDRIREIRTGNFRVNFCQGINARFLNDESAAAIASVPYYNTRFDRRTIYTAWDARPDEARLFRGLEALERAGVKPRAIMVYVLVGYDHEKDDVRDFHEDDLYRQARLREFGAMPYPMPFRRECPDHPVRKPEPDCQRCHRARVLIGFQRWCLGAYDKRVPWEKWVAADYRPEKCDLIAPNGAPLGSMVAPNGAPAPSG